MQWWELLEEWRMPHARRQGITLVARADAAACIRRIAAERCQFYGYDALTLLPDGRVELHLQWSPEWQPEAAPAPDALIADIAAHPPAVTHYEFVFRNGLAAAESKGRSN